MLFPGNTWPWSGCTFLLGSILGIRFVIIGLEKAHVIDKIVKPASDKQVMAPLAPPQQFGAEVGSTLVLSLIVCLTIHSYFQTNASNDDRD
jgi:hypothetical protein